MSETAVVSTFFELKDKMSPGLVHLGKGLTNVANQTDAATGKLAMLNSWANRISVALGTIGGAWAGGSILKDIIQINQNFEDTGLRIAGALKAYNLAPTIQNAEKQAAQVMSKIQDMAAALPGETEEYITVFAAALPKAIEAGMRSTTRIAEFTSSWMALAASNMVDAQQAGMDLFRMLSGQAGGDVRMFTVLAGKIGMTADEFNKIVKADPRQSVVLIQKALADYADQQNSAATKFSAKLGEFQSRIKEIKRLAGAALFDKARDALTAMNTYLEQNRYSLIRIGKEVLEKVVKGFETASKALRFIADNLDTVVNLSLTLTGIWVAGTLAGSISNLITLFGSMRTAAIAAQAATGVGAGASALAGGAKFATAGAAGAVGAGALAFLIPSAGAGRREVDWESEQREKQNAELELRRKYAAVITQIDARLSGMPVALQDDLQAFRDVYNDLTKKMTGPLSQSARSRIAQQRIDLLDYAVERGLDISEIMPGAPVKPITTPKERKTQNFDFRNSRFDIKQQFAEGFDPDRIAVSFAQDLGRIGEMKVSSGYAPLFGGK